MLYVPYVAIGRGFVFGDGVFLRADVTHDPYLDMAVLNRWGFEAVIPLTGAVPLWKAAWVLGRCAARAGPPRVADLSRPKVQGYVDRDLASGIRKWRRWAREALAALGTRQQGPGFVQPRMGLFEVFRWDAARTSSVTGGNAGLTRRLGGILPEDVQDIVTPDDVEVQAVLRAVRGRKLLLGDLVRSVREVGGVASAQDHRIMAAAQVAHIRGWVDVLPGVELDPAGTLRCTRCGERSEILLEPCAACGDDECPSCQECLGMGRSAGCRPLYVASEAGAVLNLDAWPDGPGQEPELGQQGWSRIARRPKRVQAQLRFELMPAQQKAAEALRKFVAAREGGEFLVWAVCGAGKTEVSFAGIEEALARGGKVLYAVPRKDVVAELGPRIRDAFPGVPVVALYGGSDEAYRDHQIVVATTHQVVRFYRAFDLVILDEADAFPYFGSEMLARAVRAAMRANGQCVSMTATPDSATIAGVGRGTIHCVRIPARHHGYPVPEPEEVLVGRDMLVPPQAVDFAAESAESGAQVFVFAPTVAAADEAGRALWQALGPSVTIAWSHSQDPQRDEKRRRFKTGDVRVLVTTSIMERGITVPRADVVVLRADFERVYDQRTLIQMAGRAGRTTQHPTGRVRFFAARSSPAMKEAIRIIRSMNREALENGYLCGDGVALLRTEEMGCACARGGGRAG